MIRFLYYPIIFIQNKLFFHLKLPAPAKLRIFYIGGYWRGEKDIVAQMLNGLKETGAAVFEFNTDEHRDFLDTENRPYDRGTYGPVWLIKEKIFPKIMRFRPHIVICNAGGLSFRKKDVVILHKLGIKLLGIALSEPDVYELATSRIVQNFDVFYSNDKDSVELHRKNNISAYQLPMATDTSFFHPVVPKEKYICDVLHLGAAHADRIESVKILAKDFDTHVYGENWEQCGVKGRGFLFGEDVLTALSSAKIVIVFSPTPLGKQIVKPQLFNFLSTGSLVLTEDFSDLHSYFDVGEDLVGFTDIDDILEKIKYYLSHPEEANSIRKAGRQKALHYTWDKVWIKLLAPLIQIDG